MTATTEHPELDRVYRRRNFPQNDPDGPVRVVEIGRRYIWVRRDAPDSRHMWNIPHQEFVEGWELDA